MKESNRNLKLLVVEDSDSDYFLLEHSLSELRLFSCSIVRATTRKDACACLAQEDFDLVVFDLTLPDSKGIDGFERFVAVASAVPIVVLTGTLDPDLGSNVLASGAQDFLPKGSFDTELLERTLRYAVERHQWSVEQKKLTEHAAYAQQLDGITTLAAGIAHDISNMLTPVLMSSELGILSAKEEEARKLFVEIRNSSSLACDLSRQLLALKGNLAGSEERGVQAGSSVEHAVKLIRRTLPNSVDLRLQLADAARSRVLSIGGTNLQQLLFNLCNNAAQASVGRKRCIIKVDVEIDDAAESPMIKVAVGDDGPGFPESALDKVFDPFYTTRKASGGSGLGLSMSREIVERSGGKIVAGQSSLGGAEVASYIPVSDSDEWEVATQELLKKLYGAESILIVDDEAAIAHKASQLLLMLGYRVDTFDSPIKALEALQGDPGNYDMILLDYAMHGMDGIRLAAEVRRLCPGVPLVMSTAYADMIDRQVVEEAGFSEILIKPYGAQAIVEVLRKVVLGIEPAG